MCNAPLQVSLDTGQDVLLRPVGLEDESRFQQIFRSKRKELEDIFNMTVQRANSRRRHRCRPLSQQARHPETADRRRHEEPRDRRVEGGDLAQRRAAACTRTVAASTFW